MCLFVSLFGELLEMNSEMPYEWTRSSSWITKFFISHGLYMYCRQQSGPGPLHRQLLSMEWPLHQSKETLSFPFLIYCQIFPRTKGAVKGYYGRKKIEGPRCANSMLRPHSQVVGKVLHAPIVQGTVQSTLPIVQHWFDKWPLEEICPTGMRRGLSMTRRSKMTCVRTNEWWVAKAWTVGTLTIWASFLRLFA